MRLNGLDVDMDEDKNFNFLFSNASNQDDKESNFLPPIDGKELNIDDSKSDDKVGITLGSDDWNKDQQSITSSALNTTTGFNTKISSGDVIKTALKRRKTRHSIILNVK